MGGFSLIDNIEIVDSRLHRNDNKILDSRFHGNDKREILDSRFPRFREDKNNKNRGFFNKLIKNN